MRVLLVLLALLLAIPAQAQQKKIGGPVGHALDVIQGQQQGSPDSRATNNGAASVSQTDLWTKIQNLTEADLTYAVALANNANTAGSKVRGTCYQAILDANKQASIQNLVVNGQTLTPPADPAIFTKLERAAEIIDNLQPTAPLITGCAAAANLAGMQTLNFVNTVVVGLGAKALSGGILP